MLAVFEMFEAHGVNVLDAAQLGAPQLAEVVEALVVGGDPLGHPRTPDAQRMMDEQDDDDGEDDRDDDGEQHLYVSHAIPFR
jgi:hypothetical protein